MGKAEIRTTRRDLLASPVVVTARGVVVNGHSRLAVAQQLGIDEVPAIVVKHPDIRSGQREEC
jgi:ParB-like chromosome segregation protein Spo0J